MQIYKSDTEEVRRVKRRLLREGMVKDHKRGSVLLLLGIPNKCKVEQPRDRILKEWGYKTTDLAYSNGEMSNVYFDGREKKFSAFGFAGRARISRESVTC